MRSIKSKSIHFKTKKFETRINIFIKMLYIYYCSIWILFIENNMPVYLHGSSLSTLDARVPAIQRPSARSHRTVDNSLITSRIEYSTFLKGRILVDTSDSPAAQQHQIGKTWSVERKIIDVSISKQCRRFTLKKYEKTYLVKC